MTILKSSHMVLVYSKMIHYHQSLITYFFVTWTGSVNCHSTMHRHSFRSFQLIFTQFACSCLSRQGAFSAARFHSIAQPSRHAPKQINRYDAKWSQVIIPPPRSFQVIPRPLECCKCSQPHAQAQCPITHEQDRICQSSHSLFARANTHTSLAPSATHVFTHDSSSAGATSTWPGTVLASQKHSLHKSDLLHVYFRCFSQRVLELSQTAPYRPCMPINTSWIRISW